MDISVLMSIYAKENPTFFSCSMDSIIGQSVMPKEIILVQDGKLTPELNDICLSYQNDYPELIKIISLKTNHGLGKALQIGLLNCNYELVARMDTDDISKPDRFQKQVNEFMNDSELTILGSSIEEFSDNPKLIESIRMVPLTHTGIIKYAKKRNPFNHMTVMFKKSAVLDVGNYRPFHLCEDYYLWYRLLHHGYKAKNIAESLVCVRVDKNMFRRRGGLKYFIQEVKLQNIFLQNHFINLAEYIRNISLRMSVRFIPNVVRGYLYKMFMRKRKR